MNRARLLPRRSFGALGRTVRLELVLLTALVVVVAILTDTRPGRDEQAVAALPPSASVLPPRDAFVVAGAAGERAVTLALEPQRARVTVIGPNRGGVDGLDVKVAGRPTAPCGSGCYEAAGAVPAGHVRVSLDGRSVVLQAPKRWPPRPAGELVAHATRAFERLRSVSYVEQLASGPANRLVSSFTLEAPNRFSYRIHGGSSAIVIGSRRWDRVRGGSWDETAYSETPQPIPIWEGPISNAYVVAESGGDLTVTLLNRRVPAWFTVQLDRRSLLPRRLTMTASAHFMHHRYFGFNRPRAIFPPR